jgi:hypothetical protein
MATQYGFTQIVTNGLQLSLDAADNNSYPGSGTTWRDLSENGNTVTLSGSPTYSSNFYGGIVFNGTAQDGSTSLGNITTLGQVTACACVRHATVPSTIQRYISIGPGEQAVIRHDGSGTFMFYITTGGTLKFNSVASAIVVNTNYYFCGTWDGTTMRVYRNGVQIGTPTTPGGTMTTSTSGATISLTSEPLNGTMFNAQVYSRALSAAEIAQNYQILSSRLRLS